MFDDFVLINNESCDISADETYIYAYDDELKEILDSEWFPANTVYMCSQGYGASKAITAIKAKKYDFGQFFKDVIAEEMTAINDAIGDKEASIAFHNFIIERSKSLTDLQKDVMKKAKVYLYGNDEHYGGALISKLTSLRVIAQDGRFYNLQDTLYVDCEKDEPFPYITFPNQIKFNTHDERALIKDIIEYTNGDIIETLSQWQQRKVDCYLDMQNRDKESVRNFHYQFIDDLSIIRNADKDSLKEIEGIEFFLY